MRCGELSIRLFAAGLKSRESFEIPFKDGAKTGKLLKRNVMKIGKIPARF